MIQLFTAGTDKNNFNTTVNFFYIFAEKVTF